MPKEKVALITGVAGYWGARVAARLTAEPGWHVIGLDVEPPPEKIKHLDFIQADVRNPLMVDLLKQEKVEAVCHLNFIETTRPTEAAFDANVMGTIRLFGACVEARVRKIVLKSSTAVYGAHPDNPAFLTEAHPLRGSYRYGYTRDMVEIEAFCNGFRRQAPQIQLTILRFPGIIGPTADTPMTRFLKETWTPTLLGFDPMMQVIHEDDVVEALGYALLHNVPGVFNVAAEGVLPLWKVTALARKPALPICHWLAYWGVALLGESRLRLTRYVPIELDYIRYSWVADLTRMREELGFTPRYTAEEALREFGVQQHMRRYMPEKTSLAYDEEPLRATLERRRRAQARPPRRGRQAAAQPVPPALNPAEEQDYE